MGSATPLTLLENLHIRRDALCNCGQGVVIWADHDGNFAGGVFAPGVELTIEAFYLMTARLPRIRVEKPARIIGKGTVSAMQSGIFWGYVGLIESLIKRIQAEYGEPMKVVATGGLATVFKDEIGLFVAIEPDLMAFGLLEIWRRNRR